MSEQSDRNKALVLDYMEAFRTFDTDRYFPYLAEEPTYIAGANIRKGRAAFKSNTDAGKLLYPDPAGATNEYMAVVAEGDWVAVLLKRRARTNKVDDYENIYTMFYEVRDGLIHTQVEMLDFRVSTDKFDLSVLDPDR